MLSRLVTLVMALGFAVTPGASSAQAAGGATLEGIYASLWGVRHYRGYVPSSYRAGTPVPLVVALHGCTQTGSALARLTRFTEVAEQRGFIVVYPEQSLLANPTLCWNWFLPQNQVRGTGEPSIIAGITDLVRSRYTVDPRRIFVTGISAGAVMSVIMAVTYPDVYASAGVAAGCEYRCDVTRSRSPDTAGRLAYEQMGPRARPVPVIVFQGTADPVVPPVTAERVAGQWAQTDDLALDGVDDDDIDAVPDEVVPGAVPGGRTYTRYRYGTLIERYMIDGAGHSYPGGCSCELFADPSGPDATALQWAFFAAHPKG